MKVDIDTILYIIISIIIIAASTLGRRRKKSAQQAPPQGQAEDGQTAMDFPLGPFSEAGTLFETVTEPEDTGIEYAVLTEEPAEEDQPLEQIIDEEEMIVDEKAAILEEPRAIKDQEKEIYSGGMEADEEIMADAGAGEETMDGPEEQTEDGELFRNPSEIQRAVIYSEILKRPDY